MGNDNQVILWQQISNQYCSQSNTTWSNETCRSRSTLHQGETQ